jgi:hypothetical protein
MMPTPVTALLTGRRGGAASLGSALDDGAAVGKNAGVAPRAVQQASVKIPLGDGHNAAEYAKYKQHLDYSERFGSSGVKTLENGRNRYYGEFKPASNPGDMAGARYVREWDPASGRFRDWYETLDHGGNVRSVAPKPPTNPLNHHIFDEVGNYLGRR